MTPTIPRDGDGDGDVSEAQARAYLSAAAAGFGILLDDWRGLPNGTAMTSDTDGTCLIHFPGATVPLVASVRCAVHGVHRVPVQWPHELDTARQDAARCAPTPRKRTRKAMPGTDDLALTRLITALTPNGGHRG